MRITIRLEFLPASLFIAGRAKDMPDAVVAAIKWVCQEVGQVADPDAFITALERTGRLQFECWD